MAPTRRLNVEEQQARKQQNVLEKDETERQLEKFLFGDQAGFLDSLQTTAHEGGDALARIPAGEATDEDGSEDEGLQDVLDEDLFFLDAGTTELPEDVMEDLREEQVEKAKEERSKQILWHDSDDDRITVSLASNTRLRKLRDTEDDDVVTGYEYIRRLRRQYERLHPPPQWVEYARKKRKLSHGNMRDSDTDSDVSVDELSLSSSVKPLSQLLRSSGSLTRVSGPSTGPTADARPLKLRPDVIDIQRLKDVASSGPSSIDTLQFHPSHPLLLTAGPSSTLNLYHISPSAQNANPLLASLHLKGTPLTTAAFALSAKARNRNPKTGVQEESCETQIYLSARRRYFHTWSLQKGTLTKVSRPLYQSRATSERSKKKNQEIPTTEHLVLSPDSAYIAIVANTGSSGGVVHLLSSASHQPISQVRVDSLNGIAEVVFYRDSSGFSVVGKNGEVSEYNIAERRLVARWMDEGAVGTTTIALGGEMKDPASSAGSTLVGNDRWIAIGSTRGIVNVYDRRLIIQHFAPGLKETRAAPEVREGSVFRPKPLRSFDHLTTPISHLHFSADSAGQLLIMASRWKKNALRLVHLPGCTVYKNWPTDKTPLGRISSVAMSADGGHLAVGSETGKVKLWQIRD